MEPANSAKKHFWGGVFFGRNCPHNAEIQMDDSVRNILSAEMASIARALEVAHLVSRSQAQNLLLVVDNLQAVRITPVLCPGQSRYPRTGPVGKNLSESDPEPPEYLSQF